MSTYVLYNALSGNGTGKQKAEAINAFLEGKNPVYQDVTKITFLFHVILLPTKAL